MVARGLLHSTRRGRLATAIALQSATSATMTMTQWSNALRFLFKGKDNQVQRWLRRRRSTASCCTKGQPDRAPIYLSSLQLLFSLLSYSCTPSLSALFIPGRILIQDYPQHLPFSQVSSPKNSIMQPLQLDSDTFRPLAHIPLQVDTFKPCSLPRCGATKPKLTNKSSRAPSTQL